MAAVLFLGGFGLLAVPPTPAEAPDEIAGYLTGHRTQVIAVACAIGLGACLFAWFLSALRGRLRDGPLAATAVLTGVLSATLVLVALGLLAGLVFRPLEPSLALLGFDLYNALVTLAGFGFGASLVAAALAGGLSPRLRTAALVIGPLQLATMPGLFVDAGVFAAGGLMAILAFWVLTGWYVAAAVGMIRR